MEIHSAISIVEVINKFCDHVSHSRTAICFPRVGLIILFFSQLYYLLADVCSSECILMLCLQLNFAVPDLLQFYCVCKSVKLVVEYFVL